MCGACGAGSGRPATQHWSAPFLASVPARSAAARTLTRWGRAATWSGTVTGVAGGFEIATSSGRRSLAPDLAATLERLGAYGMGADRLLAGSGRGVAEGPPTRPGRRPRSHRTAAAGSTLAHQESPVAGGSSRTLPPDPRRWYRVPGLLAWLAAAEQQGPLGRMTLHLGLGGQDGMVLVSDGAGKTTCEVAPAPASDVVIAADEGAACELAALLCPGVT